MYSSTLESALKSTSSIVSVSVPPVIVVGLPRSGSSYLSHVLSCMDDWFIFDDLYPYQKAASLGISSQDNLAKDSAKLAEYINQLAWQLRAKIKFERNFQVPNITLKDTFEIEEALLETFRNRTSITWYEVLEEWMTRLALHSGKRHWGYKTPQDFMHMDELSDLFPEVKFIYILRDPRKVMSSFKNLPRIKTHGSQDGESRQYHPVVYALYWKTAYEKVKDFSRRKRAPIEVVKFEDLIQKPEAVAERLAAFLGTTVSGDVASNSVNSSFKSGNFRSLTPTEIMICEKIAGEPMQAEGYQLSHSSFRIRDLFDLAITSIDFVAYQVQRLLTNKRARASIACFIKNLGGSAKG
jgi:hypothetical protein